MGSSRSLGSKQTSAVAVLSVVSWAVSSYADSCFTTGPVSQLSPVSRRGSWSESAVIGS